MKKFLLLSVIILFAGSPHVVALSNPFTSKKAQQSQEVVAATSTERLTGPTAQPNKRSWFGGGKKGAPAAAVTYDFRLLNKLPKDINIAFGTDKLPANIHPSFATSVRMGTETKGISWMTYDNKGNPIDMRLLVSLQGDPNEEGYFYTIGKLQPGQKISLRAVKSKTGALTIEPQTFVRNNVSAKQVEYLGKVSLKSRPMQGAARPTFAHLKAAIEAKDLAQVRTLTPLVGVNATNKNGETPLMIAASSSTPEIVKYLLDQGADINKKTLKALGEKTAFNYAAGRATIIILLNNYQRKASGTGPKVEFPPKPEPKKTAPQTENFQTKKSPVDALVVGDVKTLQNFINFAQNSMNKPNEILGIPASADKSAINKAFRNLSLKVHPDKWPQNIDLATEAQQLITAARNRLLM